MSTRYLATADHIEKAIQENQVNECITCYQAVIQDTFTLYEEEDTAIPLPINDRQLYGIGHDSNEVELQVVQYWNFTFRTRRTVLHYGNCPDCFQALPLGVSCGTCMQKAITIYCVPDSDAYKAPDDTDDRSSYQLRLVRDHDLQPVMAFDLSWKIMGIGPAVPMSWNDIHDPDHNLNYDPVDQDLYQIFDIRTILSCMLMEHEDKGKKFISTNELDNDLTHALQVTDDDIDKATEEVVKVEELLDEDDAQLVLNRRAIKARLRQQNITQRLAWETRVRRQRLETDPDLFY